MTEVAFHFGAHERLAYTCRLLRKATATGARLVVRCSQADCATLDSALWNVSSTDFISHCDASAPKAMRARSSVLLQPADEEVDTLFPILVNLVDDVPAGFEQYERVIEVVSTDEQERILARRRWRHYTERGYAITRHDLKSRTD